MSGSHLGAKKRRKIETLLGRSVCAAITRAHDWADVYFSDGTTLGINYKRGNVVESWALLENIRQTTFDEVWNKLPFSFRGDAEAKVENNVRAAMVEAEKAVAAQIATWTKQHAVNRD